MPASGTRLRAVLAEFALHAIYYLASVTGYNVGYSFVLDGFGVYSPELARELRRGTVRSLPRGSKTVLGRVVRELCARVKGVECSYALIYAARLHFIAKRLYPPVDDPIEYAVLRYPGMDRAVAEAVLDALRMLGLV